MEWEYMSTLPSFENPFEKQNALDMDDRSIFEMWCAPYRSLLDSSNANLLREKTLFIEGGRGCGKTMLLRYLSFEVQMLQAENKGINFLDFLTSQKAIAFYIRIDNATLLSFGRLRGGSTLSSRVFTHFFELSVCRSYLMFLERVQNEESIRSRLDGPFFEKLRHMLGAGTIDDLRDAELHVENEMEFVDSFRKNRAFEDVAFRPKRSFEIGDLSAKFAELICSTFDPLRHVRFLIAIDEYENFSESFQRVINSLIRSSGTSVGFRLGMRHEGLKTKATVQKDEFIKENHDYRTARFLDILVKETRYREFLQALAEKRLMATPFFKDAGMTNIADILGKEDDVKEARHLVASHPSPIAHFSVLKNVIRPEQMERVVSLLRCPDNPLIEMLNILYVLRGQDPELVAATMQDYLGTRKKRKVVGSLVQKYRRDYVDKYKLALLFLLTYLYKSRKLYYGFNIYSFISSGIPRNFINLCKTAFLKTYFERGHEGFDRTKSIPEWIQDAAAKSEAEVEMKNTLSLPKYAREISSLARNLGRRFVEYHNDPWLRYPETNTFSVGSLENRHQEILSVALMWSVVQKKLRSQASGPGRPLADIYNLNRLLSPFFNISYRTRGGVLEKIDDDDFSLLCTADGLPKLRPAKRAKKAESALKQKRLDETW
jgi:hypothetical protein